MAITTAATNTLAPKVTGNPCHEVTAGRGDPVAPPENLSELAANVEAVVVAEATAGRVVISIDQGDTIVPFTVTQMTVVETLSGKLGSSDLHLRQVGSPTEWLLSNTVIVSPGNQHVIALTPFTLRIGDKPSGQYGPYPAARASSPLYRSIVTRIDPLSTTLPSTSTLEAFAAGLHGG